LRRRICSRCHGESSCPQTWKSHITASVGVGVCEFCLHNSIVTHVGREHPWPRSYLLQQWIATALIALCSLVAVGAILLSRA
jgi:hypothetical protein